MSNKISISDALRLLSLPSGTDKSTVKKRYRELAKIYHPDQFNNYPKQADSLEQFIAIQSAYELLMSLPGEFIIAEYEMAEKRALNKNPFRGTYSIPDWIIIDELKNTINLFSLLINKRPALWMSWKWMHIVFSQTKTDNSSFLFYRFWNNLMNGIRWFALSVIYLSLFVCGFFIVFSIGVCFILFYPFLFIGKKISTATSKAIQQKYGYYPSATCGNIKGEITYLLLKTIPALLWTILTCYIWSMAYHITFLFLFTLLPLGFFTLILLGSVLYEWVCFAKVRQWKGKQ